jgi:hypothetical protein
MGPGRVKRQDRGRDYRFLPSPAPTTPPSHEAIEPGADLDIDAVLKADGTALTELIAFRRAELRGNDVGSNEWLRYADRLRDAADRLIESTDRLAGVLHAVRDERPAPAPGPLPSSSVAGLASLRRGAAMAGTAYPRRGELPCGHRSPCVACTPDGVIAP